MSQELSSRRRGAAPAFPASASRALRLALVAGAAVGLGSGNVFAGPRGEQVVRGRAEFTRTANGTVIRAADRTIINYRSFDIGGNESVQFIQPSARARVLNRIDGATPTKIDGQIIANGRVYIVNPSGVIFGPGAVVNAARIYAAGGAISDADFLRGVDRFSNVTGPVVAQGLMTAEAVTLVGSRVANHGTIVADKGMVSMLVGADVLVGERGGQIFARLDGADPSAGARTPGSTGAPSVGDAAGVENTGTIRAAGGRVMLAAGDAFSLAVRNTGRIDVSAGSASLVARGGGVVNAGEVLASVDAGRAGKVFLAAPYVTNEGTIAADANAGRAGAVALHSANATTLASGSTVSAAGGEGVARAGVVDVQSFAGDTTFAPGAILDISGGALGGDAGFAEISAARRLGVHGELVGGAAEGWSQGAILFDPLDIIISSGPEFPGGFDGGVDAGEGGATDIFRIAPATIEGFAGDVRLEATRDIYVGETINKANGGLTLDAGRDILLSGEFGGFLPDLSVTANFLDIRAGRTFDDRSLFDAKFTSLTGDIALEAAGGRLDFGLATVPNGRTLRLTQRDDLYIGAGPFGLVGNRQNTNLVVNVTGGWLVLGGEFGGVSGEQPGNEQRLRSLRATARDYVRVEDNVIVTNFADLRSPGEVQIDGFIHATAPGSSISLHAGTDGGGRVRFLSPGHELAADSITLRAGNNSGLASADIDAVTNAPTFRGRTLGASRPVSFTYVQDAPVASNDLPAPGQFGAPVAGMNYWIESSDVGVDISDNARVDGSRLTLSSETESVITDHLTLASLLAFGRARLGADITTTGDQTYTGPVTLASDVALSAQDIDFQATFDGAYSALVDADVHFAGAVGGVDPLRSLIVTRTAAIDGGAVRTIAGQEYRGATTLGANTALTSLDAGVIRFGATVDGAHDLSVTTTPGGLIVFGGDVGAQQRLRDLRLSTAGPSGTRDVPDRATIIGERTIAIHSRDFIMNGREKFTTLGDMRIDATRLAAIGDLTTAGDMTVSAPDIVILRREAADLLDVNGSPVNDRGVDFVAGGVIDFAGAIALGGEAGGADPSFGSATGGLVDPELAGFEFGTIDPFLVSLDGLDYAGIIRDERTVPRVVPPGPTDDPAVNSALAGGYPRTPEFVDSVKPEVYSIDALRRVLVEARQVGRNEAVAFVDGRALYNDAPGAIDPGAGEVASVATRFDIDVVEGVVAMYDELFGVGADQDVPRVAQAVSGAVGRYMSLRDAAHTTPADFDKWLAGEPGQDNAIAYVQRLRSLMSRMDSMGLTPAELRQAKSRLMEQLASGGTSAGQLSRVLAPGSVAVRSGAGPSAQGPGGGAVRPIGGL